MLSLEFASHNLLFGGILKDNYLLEAIGRDREGNRNFGLFVCWECM